MTKRPATHRRLTERLGFQLAFILAVVLLPLAFISLSMSLALVNEGRARAEAALLGETMQAASTELRLIQTARGAADTLARTIVPFIDDDAACSRIMARTAAENPHYSLVAYIPRSGLMRCSSTGSRFDFSRSPLFASVMREDHSGFVVNRAGPVSGDSVLGISRPVLDPSGAVIGIVSVSLPHAEMTESDAEGGRAEDIDLFTFDREGEILTASTGLDDLGALPSDRAVAALTSVEPLAFTAMSTAGDERSYSIVPLVPGELYALGTREAESSAFLGRAFVSTPILLPGLMWLASLIAAWLAVERLVTRNIRKLSRSIKAFAGGSRVVGDVEVGRAPVEIRDMAEAYAIMTESIMRDEAELENTIHQKEVLLREVHHRVKNNLQLIASIMNMQVRRVKSHEARQMLSELRDRVMSLATIHRELFETAGRADIHSDELLTSIVRQVTGTGLAPGRRVDTTTDFADIRMTPDQAVPLGLLVAEAVTSAMKHGKDIEGKGVRVDVQLHRRQEDEAVLKVSNSSPVSEKMTELHTGLGTQLVAAFAMQLGGRVEREQRDGTYSLRVVFRINPLSAAESRREGQYVA